MSDKVITTGPVTDRLGAGPGGLALCECVHGKVWPEGDYYEPKGKACEECSQAALAILRERHRGKTVSHHMLRRTARAKAKRLNRDARGIAPAVHYEVVKAQRGPWRWRVVREPGP